MAVATEADSPVRLSLGPSRATPLRRLLGKRAHRLGWGLLDQAVSSLTNFVVVLYAARTVDAEQFGAFSLAYITYGFALSASRGIASGPLQVRFTGTDLPAWRRILVAANKSCLPEWALVALGRVRERARTGASIAGFPGSVSPGWRR